MSPEELIAKMSALSPWMPIVLMILGALVVAGGVVVSVTPSTEDDAAWEKLMNVPILGSVLKALASFSPIQKTPKQ